MVAVTSAASSSLFLVSPGVSRKSTKQEVSKLETSELRELKTCVHHMHQGQGLRAGDNSYPLRSNDRGGTHGGPLLGHEQEQSHKTCCQGET